jgi:putative oxidoreductase
MSNTKSVVSLVVRLIVGGLFIYAGYMKVADMSTTVAMFGSMGIPVWLTYVVAWLELVGGIAVLVGFYTKKVSVVLGVIMIAAIYYTFGMGFAAYSYPLAVLIGLIVLMNVGCGKYSVGGCMNKCTVTPTPAVPPTNPLV